MPSCVNIITQPVLAPFRACVMVQQHYRLPTSAVPMSDSGEVDLTCHEAIDMPPPVHLRLNLRHTPAATHAAAAIQRCYRSYRDRHLRTTTGLAVSHAFWLDPIVAARIATLERAARLAHNEAAARRVAAAATPTEADIIAAQEHDERVQAYLDMCACRWVGSGPPSPASKEPPLGRWESP